ncbi:MAG: class I SAM-dependent methyltransferase [Bryobacteraceae bacterium]
MPDFEEFLRNHPAYYAAYQRIEEQSRVLSLAAAGVYENHGEELGPIADEILSYVNSQYADDYIRQYIARVEQLQELDSRFTRSPSAETLGDPTLQVDRGVYDLGLLLSILFTNHRFEIIQQLKSFLKSLPAKQGRIASIGAGPGYEIKLISDALPGWKIESYDTSQEAHHRAAKCLDFFQVRVPIHFEDLFPFDVPAANLRQQYDAIVLCEILEHLTDPGAALRAVRECLREDGRAFVTMAINIAQEDHVFLYPDIASCRAQIAANGLECTSEWIAPRAVFGVPKNREKGFKKGNYVAVVRRA